MKKSHLNKLERFRVRLAEIREALDDMAGEYRDKYDNASETWQESEAGVDCDDAREQLELAAAEVESAESTIEEMR